MDTEVKYSDASGKGVAIQNNLARGGLGYTDPAGTRFGYRIIWTRIINETATPFELTINFPADSFAIFFSVGQRFVDYGLTGLHSFLDTSIDKPTLLRRALIPK